MNLTQVAQIFTIVGVTVALVKLGIDIKKESNSCIRIIKNNNIEISELKKEVNNIKSILEKLKNKNFEENHKCHQK